MSTVQKSVVITGASSGIGAAAASELASRGFIVYAGVRNEEDAKATQARHKNIRALHLDVTDSASIAEAAHRVAEAGDLLMGLVNNAGIAVGGPLEYLPVDRLRRQFDVNVFGAVAVTQAFAPELREHHGRIV